MSAAVPVAGSLAPDLIERVLTRLGLRARPDPTSLGGLAQVYGAWCREVPFDNVRKLIHLRRGGTGPLPGDEPRDFFEAWLRYGAGGTCWAGNGALQALLQSLGFIARRGLGTMLVNPSMSPNHGTVVVECEGGRYVVDASILHGEPLALETGAATAVEHPAWGVRCTTREGRWVIRWRPLHAPEGIECRIERLQVNDFHERHERTRPWSPFNYSVYARRNREDAVIGVAFGRRVEIGDEGVDIGEGLAAAARARFLIEELGLHEALVAQLPEDLSLPPPPG